MSKEIKSNRAWREECEHLREVLAAKDAEIALLKQGIVERGDDLIVPMKLMDEINLTGGQWKQRAEQAEARLAAVEELVVLREYAEGRLLHRNIGTCPDEIEGHDSRDPHCKVCTALLSTAPAVKEAYVSGNNFSDPFKAKG